MKRAVSAFYSLIGVDKKLNVTNYRDTKANVQSWAFSIAWNGISFYSVVGEEIKNESRARFLCPSE